MISKTEFEHIEGNSQNTKLTITLTYLVKKDASMIDLTRDLRNDMDAIEDHVRNVMR